MSVRVTERLIGDVVTVPGLPNSPLMIVQGIDEGAKLVTTTWFSSNGEYQEGLFPASAIDRAETDHAPKAAKSAKEKTPAPKSAAKKPAAKAGRKKTK